MLVDKCLCKSSTGKELSKIDVGTLYYMRKIPILQKLNALSGIKVELKIGKILENMRF